MMYTNEQIKRANSINLEQFLRSQGEQLISSGKEKRWKRHDSVTVKGNRWFRHSQSKGGYPITFVMEFMYLSFPEAVKLLIGEEPAGENESAGDASAFDYYSKADSTCEAKADAAEEKIEFRLPKAAEANVEAREYLVSRRCIHQEIYDYFEQNHDLYLEENKQYVVFVGRDNDGIPRYAYRRSINGNVKKDVSGSNKAFNFSYAGKNKTLCVFEAAIDMLSFITLYPKDWMRNSYLSLGGVADKALVQFLNDHPHITKVYLCLDGDRAGMEACAALSRGLSGRGLKVKRLLPILKDWNEILMNQSSLTCDCYYKVETLEYVTDGSALPEEADVKMICINDVEQTEVEWLWKPYIPFGKLTILQGNPGEGKTFFAMQLTASCTNNVYLPGMPEHEPFNVIYQTAEDGLGDTIKPRLMDAGADLKRVLTIDDTAEQLTLSDNRIERAIVQNHARLLIIDPIQAFLGANVDMNRANEVRPIFRALGDAAQRTGCAIVLIGHLNKASGMQSTYRGLGSIDFTACVRSLLIIGKKKDDPNVRILAHEKSSLAPNGPSLAFKLGDEEGFSWIGECELTADQMLGAASSERKEDKRKQAKELILSMLKGGRRVLSSEIDKAALDKGISSRTVRDAKAELGNRLKSRITTGRQKEYWMEEGAYE